MRSSEAALAPNLGMELQGKDKVHEVGVLSLWKQRDVRF